MVLPNFLIIGAPRCGTTWLAKNLKLHPEVFMPEKKEIHFFDRQYEKGLAFYASHFQPQPHQRLIGEASPSYISIDDVEKRIFNAIPKVKLIVILRDPIDRLISRYLNHVSKYKAARSLSLIQRIKEKPENIHEGLYYTHITRYLRLFDRDQILILQYRDLKDQPEEVLKSVYQFLDIDQGFKSQLMTNVINSARTKPGIGKSILLYYLALVFKRLKVSRLSNYLMKVNSTNRKILTNRERRELYDRYYKDEMEKLQSEFGVTL